MSFSQSLQFKQAVPTEGHLRAAYIPSTPCVRHLAHPDLDEARPTAEAGARSLCEEQGESPGGSVC